MPGFAATLNDQQITDLNNKLVEARVLTAEARAKYDQVAARTSWVTYDMPVA